MHWGRKVWWLTAMFLLSLLCCCWHSLQPVGSILPGYYCPENSSLATPCPLGSYNPNEEAGSASDCSLCKVDHYNPYLAQTQCFHCGAEAEQPSKGQSTCICRGAGRDFQVRKKSCLAPFLWNWAQFKSTVVSLPHPPPLPTPSLLAKELT